MPVKKMIVGAAVGAVTLFGGAVAASEYPPDVPPSSTVLASSQSGFRTPDAPGELANTGSDTSTTIKIAAGAVAAGAGLVVVASRRRRPATG